MQQTKARESTQFEEAYAQLRDAIVDGRLYPHERLVEADLSESLNVSRATVRAILARLERDGLVERQKNRGARVRLVPEDEAVELMEARAVLEGLAMRHAAINATPDDVQELRSMIEEMRSRRDSGDLLGYSALNGKLHRRLLGIARHHTALKLIEELRAQVVRHQYRTVLVPGRIEQSLKEHTAMVEAVAAHDPDAAEAATRAHILHVAEAVRQVRRGDYAAIEAPADGRWRLARSAQTSAGLSSLLGGRE